MAKRLEQFEFTNGSRYPWGEWMDGSIWEIEQGVDFTIPVLSMRAMVYQRARDVRRQARTKMVDDNKLIFQVIDAQPGLEGETNADH